MADPTDTALAYFDALARRDADGMAACWRAGGVDRFVGDQDLVAPEGVREYFAALFSAFPDLSAEVLSATAEGSGCAVRYRIRGTFAGPGSFQGFAPNGARIDVEGCDVVEVADGLLAANSAYLNQADVARQLGALPPLGSKTEARMAALFNAGTRLKLGASTGKPEPVADGVWLVRGGFPLRTMNVYLLEEEGGGVTLFDAGIKPMTPGLAAIGAGMGGIRRVVLGHAHPDHRGAAAGLGAPIFCHSDARADAEGDGGRSKLKLDELGPHGRFLFTTMLPVWDGGPLTIAGTVAEGDEVAGFRVVDLPGHAPGLIGLWRESDRLALASDCFFTLDPQTGRKRPARVPDDALNLDSEQARASIQKLAALAPAAAWPGHTDPIRGDVRGQLERALA